MSGILEGLRIVEGSAFVAAPLAGMTLAQLGADVIRFDRVGGGLDYHRWPVTKDNKSLFWAGLNKGKRSIAVNVNTPEGQEIVTRLVCAPGDNAGIFLTNLRVRGWMSYENLKKHRKDLIMVEVLGHRDGKPAVDYTVNPSVGFPFVTGNETSKEPVSHVLPAWDCITGQMLALGILAAERNRRLKGEGQHIKISLTDVALAMLGNLGNISEVMVNKVERPKYGNYLYGAYGKDFVTKDGKRIMLVGLTRRQWDGIAEITGLTDEFNALANRLGLNFKNEGDRFQAREEITAILEKWFLSKNVSDFKDVFDKNNITWSVFRTFKEVVEEDQECSPYNPMFSMLEQPGIGSYLTPGTPFEFSSYPRAEPIRAAVLGEHTDEILSGVLGMSEGEIAKLHDAKIIGGPHH
ncbi:MAG: CoA transferase [Leptospiraceae bacterium]|nr:CoA transferase [Leptospiraceae bacterium]MCP5494803.1 CoA transferase [Leptospiraceae bacterium]